MLRRVDIPLEEKTSVMYRKVALMYRDLKEKREQIAIIPFQR